MPISTCHTVRPSNWKASVNAAMMQKISPHIWSNTATGTNVGVMIIGLG